MSKINELDKVIVCLKRLNEKSTYVTVKDIEEEIKIKTSVIKNSLEYLESLGYCNQHSNSYYINFEGEIFIEKALLFFKKRPFYYQKLTKGIKLFALFTNSIILLLLSLFTYFNQKKAQTTIPPASTILKQKVNSLKRDTIKQINILDKTK